MFTDSAEVYHGTSYGMIWICRPCSAYVGVHKGTENALGTLADAETRKWRRKAHEAFDPLWQSGRMTRREAYQRLRVLSDMSAHDAHISRMTAAQCMGLIRALRNEGRPILRAKGRIDSKPGVATKRTDHSLPDCGCTHVAPWEHCQHTQRGLNG
jgi:hypothetical protein